MGKSVTHSKRKLPCLYAPCCLGILLPERQTQLPRRRKHRIRLLPRLRWQWPLRCASAARQPAPAGLRIRLGELANFRHRLREDFSSRLMSSKTLACLLSPNIVLISSRSLARKLADLGNADGDHRQLGDQCSVSSCAGGKRRAHVGHRRQTQVGLVDAVQADGLVVGHLRERRRQFRRRWRRRPP